jgi:hypothetical protein
MRGKEAKIAFWWGSLRERGHLEDSGVDGKIILRWLLRMWDVWLCIERAKDRDRWRELVNVGMNLRVQ